jgi:hypothetical protein
VHTLARLCHAVSLVGHLRRWRLRLGWIRAVLGEGCSRRWRLKTESLAPLCFLCIRIRHPRLGTRNAMEGLRQGKYKDSFSFGVNGFSQVTFGVLITNLIERFQKSTAVPDKFCQSVRVVVRV